MPLSLLLLVLQELPEARPLAHLRTAAAAGRGADLVIKPPKLLLSCTKMVSYSLLVGGAKVIFKPTLKDDKFTRSVRPCGEALALVECAEAFFQLLLQLSVVARLGYCSQFNLIPPPKKTHMKNPKLQACTKSCPSAAASPASPLASQSSCRSCCKYVASIFPSL